MKTIADIFKENKEAKTIPEVNELVKEYNDVCDALIDFQQVTEMSKEKHLKILVSEIKESLAAELKRDDASLRFKESPRVDFRAATENLLNYIQEWSLDNRVYF